MPGDPRTSNSIVILALIGLIFVIMATLGYALYIVKNTMNVHLIQKESQKIAGKNNYSASQMEWKEYDHNEEFSFQYPANWDVRESDKHLFSLKRMNTQKTGSVESQLLVMSLNLGELKNPGNLELAEAISDGEKKLGDSIKINLEGNEMIRTGKTKCEAGLPIDSVYWKGKGGNVYYLEAIYYNTNSEELEEIFEEVVASLKIL